MPTVPTHDEDDALDRLLNSLMQGVVDTIEPRNVASADAVGDMARWVPPRETARVQDLTRAQVYPRAESWD